MENAPVIRLFGYNVPPEIEEKYNNWTTEVYLPNLVKRTPVNEIDRYHIIKKDPAYPDYFNLWHINNVENYYKAQESAFLTDVRKDVGITFSKIEYVWDAFYYLMRSFRNSQSSRKEKEVTTIEDAPFVIIETFRLTPEEEAKYAEWCVRYANRIYIPLLMKIPGVKGYDRYRNAGLPAFYKARESNYPSYLHILYFENEKAFEEYGKSPELASYKKALKSDISDSLVPQWYVQYQLIKSFRK
jgi:hypothetical protein